MADKKSAQRDWGRWFVLSEGPGYKVKRMEVLPGHRLSLQTHDHRSEHWTVVAGEALVTLNDKSLRLKTNQSITIPQGSLHRLANKGKTLLVVVEVQVGSYVGEDDIKRLQDDYGRVQTAKRRVATAK